MTTAKSSTSNWSARLNGAIWTYTIAWMFILVAVRLATEKVAEFRTRHHQRSAEIITQSLQPHVPGSAPGVS